MGDPARGAESQTRYPAQVLLWAQQPARRNDPTTAGVDPERGGADQRSGPAAGIAGYRPWPLPQLGGSELLQRHCAGDREERTHRVLGAYALELSKISAPDLAWICGQLDPVLGVGAMLLSGSQRADGPPRSGAKAGLQVAADRVANVEGTAALRRGPLHT